MKKTKVAKKTKRKPAAMVRISPPIHKKMRDHLERHGLVQARFVDRAILAALSNAGRHGAAAE